jgi:hypothetical protein
MSVGRLVALLAVALGAQSVLGARPEVRQSKPVALVVGEDYERGTSFDRLERDFQLLRELGISHWRGSFSWIDEEPARGKYEFAWLEQFLSRAERHHVTLHPYVAYTPTWAARPTGSSDTRWNRPPADERDWINFLNALGRVLRRHSNVASIEIYNEENAREWWDGSPADYARLLADAGRTLRRHTHLPIVFGGIVFPDAGWVRDVCAAPEAAARFTVIPLHAYPETWLPPDVTVESYGQSITAFTSAADAACGRKSIWVNEAGYATTQGKSERDQANWWVRAVATFLAQPRVEQIGIYRLRDLAADRPSIGGEPNYHLGLVRADGSKKTAFETIRLLHGLLDVGRLTPVDEGVDILGAPSNGLRTHMFRRPDGDRVLVMWQTVTAPETTVRLRDPGERLIEYAIDGTQLPSPNFDGHSFRVRLAAGEPRVYRIVDARH